MTEITIDLTSTEGDLATMLDDAVPPPACGAREVKRGPRCGTRASWLGILSCGHDAYLCDAHRDRCEAAVKLGAPCAARAHGRVPVTVRFEPIR